MGIGIKRALIIAAVLCATVAAFSQLHIGNPFFVSGVLKATAAGGSFEPDDISGLLLWVAADYNVTNSSDVSPPSDADAVKAVGDRSGNQFHLLGPSGAENPTYKTAIQNGKPVLRFAKANNEYLTNTMRSVLNGTDVSGSFFVMVSVTDTNLANYFTYLRNSTNGSSAWWTLASAAAAYGTQKRDNGSGLDTPNYGYPTVANRFDCVNFVYSGQTLTIYTNNVQMVTDTETLGVITFDSLWVGRSGSTYLGGDLGELLIYNTALSSGDRTSVYNYLKTRWGTP